MMTNILEKVLLFGALSDENRFLVERAAQVKSLESGQILVHQGDRLDSLRFLLDGFVSRSRGLPDGRRQITAILVPGDICDIHECLRRRSDYTIKALKPGMVAEIPRLVVMDWITTNPGIAQAIWRAAMGSEAKLGEWLLNIGHRTPAERIAHLLCELLIRLRGVGLADDDAFEFPLNQADLGELVGLSTVHVNRTLQRLRAEELIATRRYRVTILDFPRLKRLALFEPDYLRVDWPDLPAEDGSDQVAAYTRKPVDGVSVASE